MIETDRIAASITKEKGFRELVFSADEISYCESKTNKYQHYAARFAAKEAFFKALGTGWKDGTSFNEIQVQHDADGKPELKLLGETATILSDLENSKIFISLTHLAAIASAVVIIEK